MNISLHDGYNYIKPPWRIIMIKGCQKKIILVKDTKSRYFDSAYFVIKGDLPEASTDSDMLAEAHRIIADCVAQMGLANVCKAKLSPAAKKRRKIIAFVVGALLAPLALACATVIFVVIL